VDFISDAIPIWPNPWKLKIKFSVILRVDSSVLPNFEVSLIECESFGSLDIFRGQTVRGQLYWNGFSWKSGSDCWDAPSISYWLLRVPTFVLHSIQWRRIHEFTPRHDVGRIVGCCIGHLGSNCNQNIQRNSCHWRFGL